VFGDLELGQGRQAPWGPQAVVIAQGGEAQLAAAQRSPQVALHPGQIARSGGGMEGIHHDPGGLIRRQGGQELPPELTPALARDKVGLQLGAQQRPGFAAQALDHMAEVDPPQGSCLPLAAMESGQCQGELTAQEQIHTVTSSAA
jgi:hypothetical protein